MNRIISFVMPPLMALEILVAEFIIARFFQRKPYFYLRFLGNGFLCIFLTSWIESMYFLITGNEFNYGVASDMEGIIFKIFYYLAVFAMTILCVHLSYDQSIVTTMVCCSIGYAAQHLLSSLSMLIGVFTDFIPTPYNYIANGVVWLTSRAIMYTILYKTTAKRRFDEENYKDNNKNKITLTFAAVIVFICLSRLANDDPYRSFFAQIAEPIYAMLCSVFIIVIAFSIVRNDRINQELLNTRLLLSREREQYLMTKENIEIINEKCHDLKHQIAFLRQNKSDQYISEIEKAVMIYDSTVKTGNSALDLLLTEKKLQCESKKIKLTAVINGKLLDFMDDMDVYSLFGNALSNAIESVGMIQSEDMRHIALNVSKIGYMCSIHIENPYIGEISFFDDLPQTTKDTKWHGFGMKSMRHIVTSYGGVLTVTVENGIFKVDILIPINK